MLPIISSKAAHTVPTTYANYLCHLWYSSLSLPTSISCLSASALCMSVYISTCLSACSVKSGHQGFFNCFLLPTAPKHCEAEHSSGFSPERVDRERQNWESDEVPVYQANILSCYTVQYWHAFTLIIFVNSLRVRVHLQGRHAQESRRVNHAFSPHTCVGENKSPDIRVFSLTRGLSTIYGLLLSHWGNLRHHQSKYLKLLTQAHV